VLDNDQSGGLVSTFFGKMVDADSILVRDTYMGDLNLDGVIDGSDATTDGSAGWEDGDFNYDAAVDSADASLQTAASAAQGLQKVDFPPLFVAESAEPITVDLSAYFLDPLRSDPHWTYSLNYDPTTGQFGTIKPSSEQ
ncbi:MAG TPA: hypothetical protein VFE24_02350, partial [Pirellulales bacterium]|nr:hypothetical protein [Pirellulales bacterium]